MRDRFNKTPTPRRRGGEDHASKAVQHVQQTDSLRHLRSSQREAYTLPKREMWERSVSFKSLSS